MVNYDTITFRNSGLLVRDIKGVTSNKEEVRKGFPQNINDPFNNQNIALSVSEIGNNRCHLN